MVLHTCTLPASSSEGCPATASRSKAAGAAADAAAEAAVDAAADDPEPPLALESSLPMRDCFAGCVTCSILQGEQYTSTGRGGKGLAIGKQRAMSVLLAANKAAAHAVVQAEAHLASFFFFNPFSTRFQPFFNPFSTHF